MQKDWHATLQQSLTVVSFTEICYDPQEEGLVNYDLINSSCHRNTCCCCFCLSRHKFHRHLTHIHVLRQNLLASPIDRLNYQLSRKWYFIVFIHATGGEMSWMLTLFNWNLPVFWVQLEILCSSMALSLKAVVSISFIFNAVYLTLKQNLTQMCCSFLRKLQTSYNSHNNKHLLTINAVLWT